MVRRTRTHDQEATDRQLCANATNAYVQEKMRMGLLWPWHPAAQIGSDNKCCMYYLHYLQGKEPFVAVDQWRYPPLQNKPKYTFLFESYAETLPRLILCELEKYCDKYQMDFKMRCYTLRRSPKGVSNTHPLVSQGNRMRDGKVIHGVCFVRLTFRKDLTDYSTWIYDKPWPRKNAVVHTVLEVKIPQFYGGASRKAMMLVGVPLW